MKNLFDTDEKKRAAIHAFRELKNVEGWKLIVQMLNANIEYYRMQLEQGKEGETKEDIQSLRDRIFITVLLSELPDYMIKYFEEPGSKEENFDPYFTIDELIKLRREKK